MTEKIRRDAEKTPVSHIVIITLFAVGATAIPLDKLFCLFIANPVTCDLLSKIILRAILSSVAIVFIFKYGYQNAFKGKCGLIAILSIIPAILVAVNNAPIVGLITGDVKITESALNIFLYITLCLSIGVYEEVVFRGLILPLCLKITERRKKNVFWGVALSSAVFGVSHLIGLFSGAIGATFLQVGYSFLIGAMCAIALVITKNLFTAIALHFIYDVGGLMTTYIAVGNQWDIVTIIITAVLGVLTLLFLLFTLLKIDYNSVKPLYYPNGFTVEKEENKN